MIQSPKLQDKQKRISISIDFGFFIDNDPAVCNNKSIAKFLILINILYRLNNPKEYILQLKFM